MFKSVDAKIRELGYTKTHKSNYIVQYMKLESAGNYYHVVELQRKIGRSPTIISYDRNLTDTFNIGNTAVSMTLQEIKLFCKKIKQLGWTKNIRSL